MWSFILSKKEKHTCSSDLDLRCAGAEQPQAPEHRSPLANAGLQLKIAMVMRLRTLFKAGLMPS